MAKTSPRHDLLAESLRNRNEHPHSHRWKAWGGDLHFEFYQGSLQLLLEPSPQLRYLDVRPSTRRRTRRCTVDHPIGHSKAGFVVILEGELRDRIFCTKHSDTSVEAVSLVYPASTRYDEVQLQVIGLILLGRGRVEVPHQSHQQRIEHRPHKDA